MANATNEALDATIKPADATNPAVNADEAAPGGTSSAPQVGDVIPRGMIAGVRLHADGCCEISFDGAAWQPL